MIASALVTITASATISLVRVSITWLILPFRTDRIRGVAGELYKLEKKRRRAAAPRLPRELQCDPAGGERLINERRVGAAASEQVRPPGVKSVHDSQRDHFAPVVKLRKMLFGPDASHPHAIVL